MGRNLAVDVSKIFLAIAVVGIHTQFLVETSDAAHHFLTQGLFRIAVPIFFVFNGYYVEEALNDSTKLKKWLQRLAMLYCFWMLIYLPLYFSAGAEPLFATIKRLARTGLVGYHHLWYIVAMFPAVLILKYVQRYGAKVMIALALLMFSCGTVLQYLNYYEVVSTPIWFFRNGVLFGFPMMTAGYLLKKYAAVLDRRIVLSGLVLGAVLLAVESYLSFEYPKADHSFDMYLSLLILAPSVAGLLLQTPWRTTNGDLTRLSSEIYFTHTLFMSVLYRLLNIEVGTTFFCITLLTCLVFFWPINYLAKKYRFIL